MSMKQSERDDTLVERLTWVVVGFGSLALSIEMVVVFASAVLRNLGIALPGTIEIVEVTIVVIASMALIMTTLAGTHATIRLVIDRMRPGRHRVLHGFAHLAGALFWGLLAAGSFWIITEVWGEHEVTMLVGIPIVPFRLVWVATCLIIMVYLIIQAFASSHVAGEESHES